MSYRVESAEEIAARERARLLALRRQIEARAEWLNARIAAARAEFAEVSIALPTKAIGGETGTPSEIQRANELLESQIAAAEETLRGQVSQARVSRLLAVIPERANSPRSAADALARHAAARPPAPR